MSRRANHQGSTTGFKEGKLATCHPGRDEVGADHASGTRVSSRPKRTDNRRHNTSQGLPCVASLVCYGT
jgi:hypothetical protein